MWRKVQVHRPTWIPTVGLLQLWDSRLVMECCITFHFCFFLYAEEGSCWSKQRSYKSKNESCEFNYLFTEKVIQKLLFSPLYVCQFNRSFQYRILWFCLQGKKQINQKQEQKQKCCIGITGYTEIGLSRLCCCCCFNIFVFCNIQKDEDTASICSAADITTKTIVSIG